MCFRTLGFDDSLIRNLLAFARLPDWTESSVLDGWDACGLGPPVDWWDTQNLENPEYRQVSSPDGVVWHFQEAPYDETVPGLLCDRISVEVAAYHEVHWRGGELFDADHTETRREFDRFVPNWTRHPHDTARAVFDAHWRSVADTVERMLGEPEHEGCAVDDRPKYWERSLDCHYRVWQVGDVWLTVSQGGSEQAPAAYAESVALVLRRRIDGPDHPSAWNPFEHIRWTPYRSSR